MMARFPILVALGALATAAPAAAQDRCLVCEPDAAAERPLVIEIHSNLVFSRLALIGRGEASAALDPQTGRKVMRGMVDLGGQAVQGRARITGSPNRAVRVILPGSVAMSAPGGGEALLTDFVTDLPPWPVLDGAGQLEFSFGGSLVLKGPVGGALRGRIPITVEYN